MLSDVADGDLFLSTEIRSLSRPLGFVLWGLVFCFDLFYYIYQFFGADGISHMSLFVARMEGVSVRFVFKEIGHAWSRDREPDVEDCY